jgi:hypothetical protein
MIATSTRPVFREKRGEIRTASDRFYSVEICIRELAKIYQFKLRDMSSKGAGILIKNDSEILKHLHVGDIMKMRYFPQHGFGPPKTLTTQIMHITRHEMGRYQGHHTVGLFTLEIVQEDPGVRGCPGPEPRRILK